MIDSVPGSLAAAPTPMIDAGGRPASATVGERAPNSEPPMNTPRPPSITRLRPRRSPSVPMRQHEGGEGQGVAVHDPLQLRDAGVQARLHVGQRDADDRRVEERQKEDGGEGGKRGAAAACGGRRPDVAPRPQAERPAASRAPPVTATRRARSSACPCSSLSRAWKLGRRDLPDAALEHGLALLVGQRHLAALARSSRSRSAVVGDVTFTAVTLACVALAIAELACALITVANCWPFCRRVILRRGRRRAGEELLPVARDRRRRRDARRGARRRAGRRRGGRLAAAGGDHQGQRRGGTRRARRGPSTSVSGSSWARTS